MRSVIAIAVVCIGTASVSGQSLTLPPSLYGNWETDLANCDAPEPTAGMHMSFAQGEPDQVELVNWETEGGGCDVVMVNGEMPKLSIVANCSAEEEERTAATFDIETSPDGNSLTYRPTDAEPVMFSRCG